MKNFKTYESFLNESIKVSPKADLSKEAELAVKWVTGIMNKGSIEKIDFTEDSMEIIIFKNLDITNDIFSLARGISTAPSQLDLYIDIMSTLGDGKLHIVLFSQNSNLKFTI